MLIRNKTELEAQIKNLDPRDADFLRKVYAEHERSNAEPEDDGFAEFEKKCVADGICSKDIETAWNAIKSVKDKKPDAENTMSLEDLMNHVNNG